MCPKIFRPKRCFIRWPPGGRFWRCSCSSRSRRTWAARCAGSAAGSGSNREAASAENLKARESEALLRFNLEGLSLGFHLLHHHFRPPEPQCVPKKLLSRAKH
jgi:hypothetical protein